MTRALALLFLLTSLALLRKAWRMDANYADGTWGSAIVTAAAGGFFLILSAVAAVVSLLAL